MSIAVKEGVLTNYVLPLGEAKVNLSRPPMGNRRLEIMSEVGVAESLYNTPVGQNTYSGGYNRLRADNTLDEFSTIMDEISSSINQEIESANAYGLKVLLVTPETFKAIRQKEPPAPDWAGVYVWWNGTVVYNADYIRSVLGGTGNFGGIHFTPQEFYEEATHELAESYAGSIYFRNDENIEKYFWQTNLWFMEGLSEMLGRHINGIIIY